MATTPLRAAELGAIGTCYDEPRQAAIQIAPCGEALCGRIVWLRDPATPLGGPVLDGKNEDKFIRKRPICGLPMLWGFHAAGSAQEWDGGLIYNPDDGSTYKSTMKLAADSTLRVRGYVGMSLFGKTETWTHAPASLPSCSSGARQ